MNRWTHSLAPRLAAGTVLALSLVIGTVAAQESQLSITDYGVGTEIVDRELKGEGDRFEEGTKVVFLTRVENDPAGDDWRLGGGSSGYGEPRVGPRRVHLRARRIRDLGDRAEPLSHDHGIFRPEDL